MRSPIFLRPKVWSAIACLASLMVAAPVRARQSAQTAAPRIEFTRAGYAASLDDPEATYQGARIVHNVVVNGQKGMRVHAHFTVKYAEDVSCRMIAYFYYDDDDEKPTPLKAGDSKYSTVTGKVMSSTNFTPQYDPAEYKDLEIFVPYSALNMASGDDYELKFYLALYDNEGKRFFGKSGWYKFHLTMP